MRLRESLVIMFNKIKDIVIKNRIKVAIIIGLVLLALTVGISFSVRNKNNEVQRIEEQYAAEVDNYNEVVAHFNEEAIRYNKLVSGFTSRELAVDNKSEVDTKDQMVYDFAAYYDNTTDRKTILNETERVKKEDLDIESSFYHEELKNYNELIDMYNVEAEKLNSIINRFSDYESVKVPKLQELKKPEDHVKPSWESVDYYFSEYDALKEEKETINPKYYALCLSAYNNVVIDYNIVADAYNEAVKKSAINFVTGLADAADIKEEYSDKEIRSISEEEMLSSIENILEETEALAKKYLVVMQITNPTEAFVIDRLKDIPDITGIEAVSSENDPNGLLGKEGGYISCIYFEVKQINSSEIPGTGIVEKGTDAGGAIEIYENLENALNRCDYLSQFDGTLLYSGSYVIIGTMIVRTSYKLTNKQQIALTNEIIKRLTELK